MPNVLLQGLFPWAVNKAKEMCLAGRNMQVLQIGKSALSSTSADIMTLQMQLRMCGVP
jgi:hypothetical protein